MKACIFTTLNGFSAERQSERGLHITAAATLSAVGYILLITLKDQGVAGLYIGTILVASGIYAAYAPIASWFTNNFSGRTKRSVAIATINSIGNIGGIIAGQLYRANDAPQYIHGHFASLGFMAGVGILALSLKMTFIQINRTRDRMTEEQRAAMIEEKKDLCDKVSLLYTTNIACYRTYRICNTASGFSIHFLDYKTISHRQPPDITNPFLDLKL